MNKPSLVDAIQSLYPGVGFTLSDCDITLWESDLPKPSKEELERELDRLYAEHEANEYQRQRAAEYPSFADQFDLLYHGGYDAWKTEIDKIKNKYPKVNNAN